VGSQGGQRVLSLDLKAMWARCGFGRIVARQFLGNRVRVLGAQKTGPGGKE
jgi:hypothetical protein